MLPGPRLFRSRYAALLWAGGILWTAVEVATSQAPAPHTASSPAMRDATGEVVNDADLATIAAAMPR